MASRLPKRTIAVNDVETTTSFMALMGMAQELQIEVPIAKQNVTGIKTVLVDHLTQRGGSQLVKEPKRWDTTSAASSEDLSNRVKLRELYSSTLRYVETLPGPFEMDLNQVFPNYKQRIFTSVEELKASRCVLLVAGEMGAGKTSLVNLLLGMSILPTSDLRCTAAIVEIQYGPEPCAELHYLDDSSGRSKQPDRLKCKDNSDTGNFIKELERHITMRMPETDETPYEKIKIFWPLEMLKGGATIVDSPGVGDSINLPQQLADYMERAFGFIYVINSTNAIHKHRLGQLLVKATEGNDNTFDPDTAMFVCNRWDQIHQEDADRVLNAINDRLTMILPGVKKSQLFPISIKESKVSVEYGQVTREHQSLIEGIRNFLPHTMRGKLRIYYRYLSNILKRSLYSLRLSYLSTKSSLSKMQEQAQKRDKRKQNLQKNTQEKLQLMRREVRAATIQASESLFHYLNSMHVRTRLCTWGDRELPRKEKWQNMVKNANLMISERLAFEINEWEQSSNVVDEVARNIVGKFQKQFELFTDEVAKVEGAFLNDDDKILLDFNQAMQRNANPKKALKAPAKGKEAGFLSLGASIVSSLSLDPKDPKRIFKDLFDRDPRSAMKDATEYFVCQLTEENAMISIGKYFDRFVKGIDRVGNLVPHLMKADQILLEDIRKQLTDTEAKLRIFPSLSKSCRNLQGALDMLYLQRLMVMDYTADKLEYTERDRLGQGSFATVYKARLASDIVALKEPKQCITRDDVTDILLEEAMLRETTHKNIVGYFGCYRKGSDEKIRLNMVMEFCPQTIKDKYIKSNSSPSQHGSSPIRQIQAIGVMTYFLIQICDGLSYLHDKNIVHRDLKPENLLVTDKNVVKIADLGLAKKVKDIVTTAIGTPVYMAPEVLLLSETYDTKADIYSFGMIAWELWYGQDLANYASMELQGGLKVNIEKKWRPSLTLEAAPTDFWLKLITMSWDQEPKRRPTAGEIGKKLVEVYQQVEEAKKRH